MRNTILTFIMMAAFSIAGLSQYNVLGTWKNIDDEDGKVKSHLEIYEKDGKLECKVKKLLDNASLRICTKCKGDKKDKPIEGMVIMWGMEKSDDNKWESGKIMDPKSGKDYKCKIELEDENTLKVRGYLGVPAFGRTQYWYRVKE